MLFQHYCHNHRDRCEIVALLDTTVTVQHSFQNLIPVINY